MSQSGLSHPIGLRPNFAAADAPDRGLLLPILERDHARGPDSAPITLVEYGDYQCPPCGEVYLRIEEIRSLLGSRLRFVFRHYPFSGIHPRAQLAAEAAEAAAAQGRFWEMHDMLFQHQDALGWSDLLKYAGSIGLDVARFRRDLRTSAHEERVREDFRSGVHNGVYGTPSVFINGVRHNGAFDLGTLLDSVERKPRFLELRKDGSYICGQAF